MEPYFNRRKFLKSTALASLALATTSFAFKKYQPKLSFSTLGCPDWTFDAILDFAANNGFGSIEIRGIQRQLDLIKCREFSSKENITVTKSKIAAKSLKIINLGSSSNMHLLPGPDRDKTMDDAKHFIDLAHEIDCPYIRVFPNNLPKDQDRGATIELIANGLLALGEYSKGSGVTVLMETHGDIIHLDDIEKVVTLAQHPNVGLIWDVVNMWSVTKESPADVYPRLKKYIHHTHIKDMSLIDGKERYVFLGKGQTPIMEAIDLLAKDNYQGYFSFEWEKLWHPEIEAPELAIADYAKVMKAHFS